MPKENNGSRRKPKEKKIKVKLTGLQRVFYSLGITVFMFFILIMITLGVLFLLYGDQIVNLIQELQNFQLPDFSEMGG